MPAKGRKQCHDDSFHSSRCWRWPQAAAAQRRRHLERRRPAERIAAARLVPEPRPRRPLHRHRPRLLPTRRPGRDPAPADRRVRPDQAGRRRARRPRHLLRAGAVLRTAAARAGGGRGGDRPHRAQLDHHDRAGHHDARRAARQDDRRRRQRLDQRLRRDGAPHCRPRPRRRAPRHRRLQSAAGAAGRPRRRDRRRLPEHRGRGAGRARPASGGVPGRPLRGARL